MTEAQAGMIMLCILAGVVGVLEHFSTDQMMAKLMAGGGFSLLVWLEYLQEALPL